MKYIIIFLIIMIVFILSKYINISKIEREKLTAYECGFQEFIEEISEIKKRYYLKYYIIAIIFLIFDLEILLLYPFITAFSNNLGSAYNINQSTNLLLKGVEFYNFNNYLADQSWIYNIDIFPDITISYIIIIFFILLLFLGLIFETNKFIII